MTISIVLAAQAALDGARLHRGLHGPVGNVEKISRPGVPCGQPHVPQPQYWSEPPEAPEEGPARQQDLLRVLPVRT